jgi:hypothetical protein
MMTGKPGTGSASLMSGLSHNKPALVGSSRSAKPKPPAKMVNSVAGPAKHNSITEPITPQQFFDTYRKEHYKKFGEVFELAKPNPVW